MSTPVMTVIFFFYGLSFFMMGVVITQEIGRCSDVRLRNGLVFLAAFGYLHGGHEWMEMFQGIGIIPGADGNAPFWLSGRLVALAFSFLLLGTFGITVLARQESYRRLALLVPLILTAVWSFGLLILGRFPTFTAKFWDVMDVWTRYSLAIPASLLACAGLVYQQREFRRIGMGQFGRDSLWAAVAFAWYGLIGQVFTRSSPLPPSTVINSTLFLSVFGFPVQLLRASAALVVAVFVMRFLRSFQVETQRQITELQVARLEEAQRRQDLRGELLRRVVEAQEAERQRIARELHDDTGQSLTAIGLGLRGIATLIHQDIDKATTNLRQLERMVGHSLDELQRIITGLRPSHLDDLGLAAALRWYCSDMQNRASLPIIIEVFGEASQIPAEVKTTIFRVAQEALTNVIRHANANQTKVNLVFQPQAILLDVEDDGSGFDYDNLKKSRGASWGLLGMEERVSLLGGKLIIQSNPGQGTRISVVIPYESSSTGDVENGNPPVVG